MSGFFVLIFCLVPRGTLCDHCFGHKRLVKSRTSVVMAALLITLQSISSSTVVLAEIKETTSTLLLLLLLLRVICHVLLIKVSDRLEVESISS